MTNRPFFFFFFSSFFLNAALSYLYVWVKILTTFSKKEQRVTTRLRIHYTCTLSLSGPAKNKIMNEPIRRRRRRRRRRRSSQEEVKKKKKKTSSLSVVYARRERERERERRYEQNRDRKALRERERERPLFASLKSARVRRVRACVRASGVNCLNAKKEEEEELIFSARFISHTHKI